jgi:hypothetical protein
MALGGLLHLVKQVRFHQHVHEVGAIWDGGVDGPSVCVGKPPLHHVPQDLRAFPMQSSRQLLQLGMLLRVQAGLLPHAITLLARLRLW